MGFDDPFKCCHDRRVIDNLAGPQGLLPFLDCRQELMLIGDIGSQRLIDEPRFAAPRRFGQPFDLAVEIGIDTGSYGHGL
jgi:hypothetical protein